MSSQNSTARAAPAHRLILTNSASIFVFMASLPNRLEAESLPSSWEWDDGGGYRTLVPSPVASIIRVCQAAGAASHRHNAEIALSLYARRTEVEGCTDSRIVCSSRSDNLYHSLCNPFHSL